ncbi:MAG: MFS transporter [Bifidobacteriaceae bacterium]|nr:MFS transporter [Bifidobacteriaceae bacterium]
MAAAVLAVVCGFYAAYGSHPFLTRKLLDNLSFLSIIAILFVAYFFQYACVPIYQVTGEQVYRLSLLTVSLCLTAVYFVQLVMGVLSGPIVNKIGRYNTIFLSVTLMTVGFGLSALLTSRGFGLMLVLCCVYDAGVTVIYSPMYDAAAAALPAQERGRSVAYLRPYNQRVPSYRHRRVQCATGGPVIQSARVPRHFKIRVPGF